MTATYDPSTSAGRVRLLISDTAIASEATRIFDDEEIDAFLELEGSSIMHAAALALESIAASEVLIQKRIRLLELETDGPAEANALRQLAASWRGRATEIVDEAVDAEASGFAVATLAITPSQQHETVWNEALRGA